jgi:hypothetical protein
MHFRLHHLVLRQILKQLYIMKFLNFIYTLPLAEVGNYSPEHFILFDERT